MSKVTPFLGAALSAFAISCTIQVRAQDAVPYKDVKSTHWAYDAVVRLQAKGILVGYPDHYFRGQETRSFSRLRSKKRASAKQCVEKVFSGYNSLILKEENRHD